MGVDILGPVGVREFETQICQAYQGHLHEHDHTTFVMRGAVQVFYRREGEEERESRVYAAPARFAVLKGVYHRIVALEEGTVYWCVFSHRDLDGLIVEEYAGVDMAYV